MFIEWQKLLPNSNNSNTLQLENICTEIQKIEFTKIISNLLFFVSPGQLYGLEKFWAFLKYYKHTDKLQVEPKLKEYLSKFKSIEDFRVVEVGIDGP